MFGPQDSLLCDLHNLVNGSDTFQSSRMLKFIQVDELKEIEGILFISSIFAKKMCIDSIKSSFFLDAIKKLMINRKLPHTVN